MKKYFTLFLLISFSTIGCKKPSGLKAVMRADATIRYTGEPAADGCGWLIKPDNESITYKPINLSDDYKINNTRVTISYIILDSNYMGCIQIPNGRGINQIEIKGIALK